jgi:hypothetical protein
MRISQDLAQQIAFKLTQGSRDNADLFRKEYQELVTQFYEQQTPVEVKKTFDTHPEWFSTRQRVDFSGQGFRYEQVTTTRSVICNQGQIATLPLTAKIADRLTKAKNKYEKADKECKALKDETETALINLRTFTRIRENIPAAIPFLPPPMSNALVVNVDSLNKKLNHQPAVKKAVANN